jgi:hypothetical protein
MAQVLVWTKDQKMHAGAFPTQLTKAKYRCADAPLVVAKYAKFQTGQRCVVTAALGKLPSHMRGVNWCAGIDHTQGCASD